MSSACALCKFEALHELQEFLTESQDELYDKNFFFSELCSIAALIVSAVQITFGLIGGVVTFFCMVFGDESDLDNFTETWRHFGRGIKNGANAVGMMVATLYCRTIGQVVERCSSSST